jgi:hypothetical protein
MDSDLKFWLIAATKPEAIADLEKQVGCTQSKVVDLYIEETCWMEDLPEFIGHRGTPQERLNALREVMRSCPFNEDIFGSGKVN